MKLPKQCQTCKTLFLFDDSTKKYEPYFDNGSKHPNRQRRKTTFGNVKGLICDPFSKGRPCMVKELSTDYDSIEITDTWESRYNNEEL